jgi:hypothetical protein
MDTLEREIMDAEVRAVMDTEERASLLKAKL